MTPSPAPDASRESAGWNMPDSNIATAALELMFDVSPTVIANHNVRSYLFARELAAANNLQAGLDYDDELVFLSCVLHDLGVTDYANGNKRFEVDGADAAARFLREHGVDELRVNTVWQSIALHTSLGLAPEFGPNQAVTFRGISLDVDGTEKDLLRTGFAERVHARWPRYDLGYAIAQVIARDIEANPIKGPPFSFPAHVHQLIFPGQPVSFSDVVRHSGWSDKVPQSHPDSATP